jgi:hypothetical protein
LGAVKRISAVLLFGLLLAGCGNSSPKATTYTLGPTRECARAHGHVLKPKQADFIATTASGGAFRLKFPDNEATVLFGADAREGSGLADGYRRFHAKNVGVEDILRTNNNVVMLWRLHPTDKDASELTDCLK